MPLPHRPRRLRRTDAMRRLVRETRLSPDDLVYPFFVTHEKGAKEEIASMPGCFRWGVDRAAEPALAAQAAGIPAVLLFGIPPAKDEIASGAWDDNGVVQQAVRVIKAACPDLLVITDVCLCEYTSHGHCGLVATGDHFLTTEGTTEGAPPYLRPGEVLNDATLNVLARTAVSHARAGADIVAPSDMMDGRVAAIRAALDAALFPLVPILSYAAKYASAYYGPFRDAAGSAPAFGDRRAYQMDPPNRREALREIRLDLDEGADMIMVKPGLAYLDILRDAREAFPEVPLAVYNVSGEYAMIKAAAERGWLDEQRTVLETLTAFKRAGADFILTYHALDAAGWLQ